MPKFFVSTAALTAALISIGGVASANTPFFLQCADHIERSCRAGASQPSACMLMSEEACESAEASGEGMEFLRRIRLVLVPGGDDGPRYLLRVLRDAPDEDSDGEDAFPQTDAPTTSYDPGYGSVGSSASATAGY